MKKIFTILTICVLIIAIQGWVFAQEEAQPNSEPTQESALPSEDVLQNAPQIASPEQTDRFPQLQQKWQSLSQEERGRLKAKFKAFKELPPEKREKIKNNLRRFNSLAPEKKVLLINRFKRWQQLSPQEKKLARERFRQRALEFKERTPERLPRKIELPQGEKSKEQIFREGLPQDRKRNEGFKEDEISRGRGDTREIRRGRIGGGDLLRRSPIENRRQNRRPR